MDPLLSADGSGYRRCLYCRAPCVEIIGLCAGCQAELDAAKATKEYKRCD